ncbi:phosphoinositide-specific phospholipase C family protein, partial [Striga asiatica]
MMHNLFRLNGGYDVVMQKSRSNEAFDPRLPWPVWKKLKVIVYMGDEFRMNFSHTHFDTFFPPNFYTEIYKLSVPANDAKRKTRFNLMLLPPLMYDPLVLVVKFFYFQAYLIKGFM